MIILASGSWLLTSCFLVRLAAPQVVEDLVNIRFQLDVRLFAVMGALQGAGFDLDADDLAANPARAEVRRRMDRLGDDRTRELRDFYTMRALQSDAAKEQSRYVSLALFLGPPPEFSLTVAADSLPEDVRGLVGFELLVRQAWQSAALDLLWTEQRPRYAAEAERYRGPMRDMIVTTLHYLKTDARIALDRRVSFIPDLLNGYGIVNARNIADDYVVVVGPSRGERPSIRSIRHEYLHFMIDPLVAKDAALLPESEPFLALVRARPAALDRYRGDPALVVVESLLRALELRLDGRPEPARALESAREEGLVLAPYFDERLTAFERGTASLHAVFPELLAGIDLTREKNRAAPAAPARGATAASDDARRQEIRARLTRANEHLAASRFDEARALLEEVLAREPASAGALFGLAQIAGREQRLDLALDLYARAAAASGSEAWIAAWSHVRRGNIFRFQGDLERARAEWEKGAALPGELRGAAAAARKALEETRPRPPGL